MARRLHHKVTPRLMHPVQHLEFSRGLETGERLAPPRIDDQRALRTVLRVTGTRTVAARGPWRADFADEIHADICNRWQRNSDLARAYVIIGHGAILGRCPHRASSASVPFASVPANRCEHRRPCDRMRRVVVPRTRETAEIGDVRREQALLPRPFRARLLIRDLDAVAVRVGEIDAQRQTMVDDRTDRYGVVLESSIQLACSSSSVPTIHAMWFRPTCFGACPGASGPTSISAISCELSIFADRNAALPGINW